MSDTKVLAGPASPRPFSSPCRLLACRQVAFPPSDSVFYTQDGLGPTHMTPLHLEYLLKTVFPHTVPF